MKISGIIAEYNPFHNGHKYLIEQSKKITGAEYTVAVMSGDFVMRGEPACFNKLIRSRAAVRGGADLVIELPICFALSSAEYFALGGVSLLNSLKVIDNLVFGSECGDINILSEIADKLSDKNASEKIKSEMKDGIPVYEAIVRMLPEYSEIISGPNNILGINYLKALRALNSDIRPMTVKRTSAPHDSEEIFDDIASALALRKKLEKGEDISEWTLDVFSADDYVSESSFDSAVTYSLRMADKERIKNIRDVGEGLENLIYKAARQNYGITDIALAVKSKRYTYTRIKRIIYNLFLNIDKNALNSPPDYARVLAFNDKGREIINEIKKKSNLDIITNITEKTFEKHPEMYMELNASHIFSLGEKKGISKGGLACQYINN